MDEREITFKEALQYEIRAAKWPCYIGVNWLQEIVASYFVWKTKRRYNKYKQMNELEERVNQRQGE